MAKRSKQKPDNGKAQAKTNPLQETEMKQVSQVEDGDGATSKTSETEVTDVGKLEQNLAEKLAEISQLKEQDLRLRAEYDNYRRRSQQEKERIRTEAISQIIQSFLPLIDSMSRAKQQKDQDQLNLAQNDLNTEQAWQNMAQGLELMQNQLTTVLQNLQVTTIAETGVSFDPEKHSAVMHVEDDNYGVSEVIAVFEAGYSCDGRIIRPAMVKVAN